MVAAKHTAPGLPVLVVTLTLLVAACGSGNEVDTGGASRPTVVATTTILGDVVANVVGEEAEVVVLMPVGADPHDFQASSSQVADINRADLVIANGLLLEEGLDDVLDAAVADGARVVRLAPLLDPIPFGSESSHDHEGEQDHEGDDPHVWFDPIRMAEAARLIAAELTPIAPEVDWMGRADSYATELVAADTSIIETLAGIPSDRRRLVTSHEAFRYFADRYDFVIIGTVIPAGSTLADPSSEELADLVRVMEREGVRAIFAETTQSTALSEAIAAELGQGVQVVSLYTGSLDEPGTGADTLIGMLQTNAGRIATALDG